MQDFKDQVTKADTAKSNILHVSRYNLMAINEY